MRISRHLHVPQTTMKKVVTGRHISIASTMHSASSIGIVISSRNFLIGSMPVNPVARGIIGPPCSWGI
jgi:hypothetical protein